MIKIRYRDPNEFSPGLHAAAERHGRNTTVYLLPGLSAAQRRAALRRLQISARRGYDPKLPAPQLAVALAADRIRTTVGRAGAVFRSHPAGSTVPVMVVSAGAIAFLALSAVSIRVTHPAPRSPGQVFSRAAGPAASVSAGPGRGQPAEPIAAGGGDRPGRPGSVTGPPARPGSGAGQPRGPAAGGSAPAASGSASGAATSGTTTGSRGGTTLTGGAAPTPGGDPMSAAPAASSSSAAAPAASATTSKPSPTAAASKSGLCVHVGSLGLCV
jgi:hypothetical protein